MDNAKVHELAEKLKEQGLAASMYEAIEKAKSILSITAHKNPKTLLTPDISNENSTEEIPEPTTSGSKQTVSSLEPDAFMDAELKKGIDTSNDLPASNGGLADDIVDDGVDVPPTPRKDLVEGSVDKSSFVDSGVDVPPVPHGDLDESIPTVKNSSVVESVFADEPAHIVETPPVVETPPSTKNTYVAPLSSNEDLTENLDVAYVPQSNLEKIPTQDIKQDQVLPENRPSTNKIPQQPPDFKHKEDNIIDNPENQDASLNDLMTQIEVYDAPIKDEKNDKIEHIMEDISEIREDIHEIQSYPEKLSEIRKDISKINEEVDEIAKDKSKETDSLEKHDGKDNNNSEKQKKEQSLDDSEKNIDISDVFNFNKRNS